MSAKAASKVVKQLAGSGTGQSLMDRVTQAKYSLAGSGLGKAVAKATTEEIGAPKKKHIDYLVNCSNEPNVSIPLLAGLLIERTQERSWVIVFKALITTHNLMNFGNEKFSQYLATNNSPLHLPNFNDKASAQSYEMSLFIRLYSHYLAEKTSSYRAMAFDFCKVKRGQSDGVLRTMPVDKLLKALPVLAEQLNILLEFEVQEKDLNNAVINAAFLLLYKDLIRLFASYNEGMINLIERYFTLRRSLCRIGLDLYHAFPDLQTKITSFLSVAESMGIGDRDSLGLQAVPEKVIQAMEQHLAILDSKKGSDDEADEDSNVTHNSVQHAPHRPVTAKKPTVPVPLPARPATKPTTPRKPPLPVTTKPVVTETEQNRDETIEGEGEFEPTEGCPTVVVDDADGLPSAMQEEIIAAATDHFSTSIVKSAEAVKRSVNQTSVAPQVHTQMGRCEQRTVVVRPQSPARSRSPSPARPAPPHLTEPRSDEVNTVSDSELDDHSARQSSGGLSIKRNFSATGLNDAARGNRPISECGSPFAGDELEVQADYVTPEWPETNTIEEKPAAQPAAAAPPEPSSTTKPTTSSALDDLFGLDLLSCDDSAVIAPLQASPAKETQSEVGTDSTESKPKGLALDDILFLDPLLSSAPETTTTNTASATAQSEDPNGLPAGLKPVQSNVPIRPMVGANSGQNKNALDTLDTTLVDLASSLGGHQGWGSNTNKP